jgi:large subunit ribosomal protein L6
MYKDVEIPDGVEVTVNEREITVKGPKGEIKRDFDNPRFNSFIELKSGKKFIATPTNDRKLVRAVSGTITAHVKNMIIGVTKGHRYRMKIYYSHFPINVEVKDKEIYIKNFLGEKAPRIASIIGETDVKPGKEFVMLEGINVEDVGQTALNIEHVCTITKRDRRVFNDGVYIDQKKTAEEVAATGKREGEKK